MKTREYRFQYEVEDVHWWFAGRKAFLSAVFSSAGIDEGGTLSIADIGAGTGGMYAFLSRYGNVTGIEIHPEGRKYARKRGITLKNGSVENTGLTTGKYDIVCLLDVLYHNEVNEKKALAEAYRILKPGLPGYEKPKDEVPTTSLFINRTGTLSEIQWPKISNCN